MDAVMEVNLVRKPGNLFSDRYFHSLRIQGFQLDTPLLVSLLCPVFPALQWPYVQQHSQPLQDFPRRRAYMAVARSMRPISAFAYASLSAFFVPVTPVSPSSCRSSPLYPSSQQCSSFSTSTGSGQVSYRIAVSYIGKGQRIDAAKNVRAFDLSILRAKGQTGVAGAPPRSGQDAFFMGSLGNSSGEDVAFGVADGVGGWSESGIDPSAFSEGLCRYMAATAGEWDEDSDWGRLGTQRLMQAGYDGVMEDEEVIAGGSTACVAIGRTNGNIEVANLGDSGFAHFRPNAMAFFSPPQTHAFNTPYQLTKLTREMLIQQQTYGGGALLDEPTDAAVTRHKVAHGDVLVFGTDGLWDNLNSSDVLEIVRKEMSSSKAWVVDEDDNGAVVGSYDLLARTEWKRDAAEVQPQRPAQKVAKAGRADESILVSLQERLAFRVAKEAQTAATDMKRMSPFGREIQRYYPGETWRGGKVDDIAVIVAVVVDDA